MDYVDIFEDGGLDVPERLEAFINDNAFKDIKGLCYLLIYKLKDFREDYALFIENSYNRYLSFNYTVKEMIIDMEHLLKRDMIEDKKEADEREEDFIMNVYYVEVFKVTEAIIMQLSINE